MTDTVSRQKRSWIMSRIRSTNTGIELAMRAALRRAGVKYRYQPKGLFGRPDFLIGENVAVFCDSSFWHARHWRRLRAKLLRSSRPAFWLAKFAANRRRDRLVNRTLRKLGFKVVRFWDNEILKTPAACISAIRKARRQHRAGLISLAV